MCGICGILSHSGLGQDDKAVLERMRETLLHRGPDGSGTYHDANNLVLLGHSRLKIIDLTERAAQPMSNETGQVWLVCNGEIYNHLELRARLEQQGHMFRSDSDTEVLLHLYEEKGEEMLADVNGEFAFGIWDSSCRRLMLARDRLGVKPLLYTMIGDRLLFASELRALLQHPEVRREINLQALVYYVTFNYIPDPYTILKSIVKLEPANYLIAELSTNSTLAVRKCEYWDCRADPQPHPHSDEETIAELRELLEDALRIRLMSDVPLGAFLSGGVDSSLVVALMAELQTKVRTFSIGYEDVPLYDERKYARIVANRYATEHEEIVLTAKEAQKLLGEVLNKIDEPFGDSSLVPSYLVAHAARKHVTVALSGDGGDEMFGGYSKYKGEVWAQILSGLPGKSLLRAVARHLPESRGSFILNRVRMAKRFVRGLDSDPPRRHFNWMRLFDTETIVQLLTGDVLGEIENEQLDEREPAGLEFIRYLFCQADGYDPTNKALYTDIHFELPYDMFHKVDTASMLNSLEVRSPFLDYRLTERTLRIPGRAKVGLLDGKRILKQAYKDMLPREVTHRPKTGFGVPIGEWFRSDLKPMLLEVLSEKRLRKHGVFRPETVHRLMDLHFQRRRDYSWELWNLLVFAIWAENYLG